MLADTLEEILKKSGGERIAYQFLKKNPGIVLWSFHKIGGNSQYVLADFPIGIRYRADFVIPLEYSGGWEVYLVELEPVSDRVITKDGRPSKRLNSAISQVNDWAEYIEINQTQVKNDLADWCMRHDLLG
jgi:Shedu protein SduA, C-terminal